MAAGVGARFGGPKQLEPVGPAGETLIDYLLFDARRAGFTRAVLVVREEITAQIGLIAGRHRERLDVRLVFQAMAPELPRGTVPAVLAAADLVDGPFAALNADDFYGAPAYRRAADFLARPDASHAVIALPLHATLSPHGGVVRAVCTTEGDALIGLDEVRGIERRGAVIAAGGRVFTGHERVSMNFWAFRRPMLAELREELAAFSRDHDSRHELLLPVVVDRLVKAGRIDVAVLDAPGPWLGLTHASDLPGVRSALREAAARGDYPAPLWSAA